MSLSISDPNIKSLADYTDKHKIAVPAVKVSNQAIFLQMAAAKLYGMSNHTRFDPLTVSMTHPDGMAALLSGHGEISSHFTAVPFVQLELQKPGIRRIATATEILGAPNCHNFMVAPAKFCTTNPKLYGAFLAAMQEATQIVHKDKRAAAELYIRVTRDKSSVEDILRIMNDVGHEYAFNVTPEGDMKTMQFMHQIGSIKVKIRTRAPPTPEPITLASFETTRTMIFVGILLAEKEEWDKEKNMPAVIRKNKINLTMIVPPSLSLPISRL